MRNSAIWILAASLLAVGTAGCAVSEDVGSSAQAITAGTSDFEHANVGSLVVRTSSGWVNYCSGTLIAPTVFLTAAHCIADSRVSGLPMGVTFQQNIQPGRGLPDEIVVRGTGIAHPDFVPRGDGASDRRDVGVLVLDTPVVDRTPARLPTERQLDALVAADLLRVDTDFTVVGYGLIEALGLGYGGFEPSNERRQATMSFNALSGPTGALIKLQSRIVDGEGGPCFGDSGGPALLGIDGEEVLAGIIVIGDGSCQDLNFSYRTDIAQTRSFLAGFVTLP